MGAICCQAAPVVGTVVNAELAVAALMQGQKVSNFMTFTIIGARGFRNSNWMPSLGKPDCYVVVKSKDKEIFKTHLFKNSMEPPWKEEYEYQDWEPGAELEFHLYGEDLIGSEHFGKITIQHERFQDGFNGDVQLEETHQDNTSDYFHAYLHVKIKPPGKVYPPGPPVEFAVTLQRGENTPYGLDVDIQDAKTLCITGFGDGAASVYNQKASPAFQLVRGDCIVEANGASGDSKGIMDKFKNEHTVTFKVRRAIDVTLILDRKKVTNEDGTEGNLQPLGIEWLDTRKGMGLVVTAVNKGLFEDWNKSQTEDPAAKLQVGDRIVRVGNTTGSALNVSKALQKASGNFQLSLLRAAPELFDDEGRKKNGSSHWRFSN
jgi:hypothetical protein